jgi:hypothetical protein
MNKKLFASLILVFIFTGVVAAESQLEPTRIIDTPAVGMLDYGAYDLNFRLFSEGGILTRLDFGVFKVVNLGFGWELSNVIGSQDITVAPPTLYLKIKPFSGGMVLPAFAFGYDGQGYSYIKSSSTFTQKEKGIFVVFGREYFFPGFEMNFGANMNDFKTNTVYGFANVDFNIEEKIYFLAEYDNVNYLPDSRLNLGVRFFVTNYLSIDLAGHDIGASDRKTERILRIGYLGKF